MREKSQIYFYINNFLYKNERIFLYFLTSENENLPNTFEK